MSAPFKGRCPRAAPPAPPRATAGPLLFCPAMRVVGPGALVGAPEAVPAHRDHRAPAAAQHGEQGALTALGRRDPAQAVPGSAGISQARPTGVGPRNPLLAAAAPFAPEIPQGPLVLLSESVLGSDIGPGNPEHLVSQSSLPAGSTLCFSPGAAVTWRWRAVVTILWLGPRP